MKDIKSPPPPMFGRLPSGKRISEELTKTASTIPSKELPNKSEPITNFSGEEATVAPTVS
jgi:hypothetical protein